MERRKILLGSGAALATVLAGCTSTETDEESPDEDDDGGFDDGADDASDEYDDGEDYDDDDDDEEVPGIEGVKDISTDSMSVVEVEHATEALHVLIETDTTDTEKLYAELKYVADDLAHAVVDRDVFESEVETIELALEHGGSRVFAVYIDVAWVMELLDGYITEEELAAKVRDTKH
ncbi:hypothetical protein [Natrarchaeobaculum sulfurireducens]|uniref:Lipoprotein n=1 Tax=Natrarchaeobaculum sulfurireducens TaxID=2044521 RepID=A0A346PLN5_9EURY|nr:hypothetical protein [Natrarchaeobaculum sulfurireducens]AXR76759.1 hypothetical protein AArc1_0415 [Natrarchaeobaculum sulfurireducens]AXR80430.1 hypothetical protein AArcMg_0407 [Natrarchaeobaculum sulfurireducens]